MVVAGVFEKQERSETQKDDVGKNLWNSNTSEMQAAHPSTHHVVTLPSQLSVLVAKQPRSIPVRRLRVSPKLARKPISSAKPGRVSFLRWLFPRTHQRTTERYSAFRHDTVPSIKHLLQSRIYRALVRQQERKRIRSTLRQTALPFLRNRSGSRILELLFSDNANASTKGPVRPMMNYDYTGARVPGARREKLKGYLKAANELRQSYQDTFQQRLQNDNGGSNGEFGDVEIVRRGDEEMLLFPSYARRHIKKTETETETERSQPGSYGDPNAPVSSGDADYWKREWERYEDANAIVDVDVRGWIFSPQRGPMSRRNKLIIAVARRLSGIPAPNNSSPASSRSTSPHPSYNARDEEAAAAVEAENIAQRGQKEADAAWRGSYSTQSRGSPSGSRSSSPTRHSRNRSANMLHYDGEDELSKRASWNNQTMSREELLKANDLLMARLRPFLTLPLANTTITVFFFNERKSSSKTVTTNESGHFNIRAALDFVPSSVRVLASENLSATEEVIVTESQGVSLISDVDDTIKHSAIASGVKEIFKNTFVRELGDLTIKGVKEWYSKIASMGVQMHYVSNSPWQLYPLLKSYFSLAGLPPGSFHLKEYSGMLQGIFEPAAERKRGSLDRIMNDFPERKFILVGDSGEADLEVYTDVVLAHPGRVLGIFIRDVTTPHQKGFFDQSNIPLPDQASARSEPADASEEPPSLPARPKTQAAAVQETDLIDFSEDSDPVQVQETSATSYNSDLRHLDSARSATRSQAPARPAKPSNLRNYTTRSPTPGASNDNRLQASDGETKKAPPPPKPRRSSKSVNAPEVNTANLPRPTPERYYSSPRVGSANGDLAKPPPLSRTGTTSSMRSAYSAYSAHSEESYVAAAQRKLNTAYSALPAIRSQSRERGEGPPQVPPRRGITAVPAAAARWATGATGGDPWAGGDGGAPGSSYDKKEEVWKRRWARAEDIMQRNRVVLRTWRVGTDVMETCLGLVEQELQRQSRHQHQNSDWGSS